MLYDITRVCVLLHALFGAGCYGDDDDIRADIDAFMTAILSCNDVPGATLSVVRGGEVFYTAGYGVENLASQKPFTALTLVNIASVSKHFTSTTMAKALEQNPSYDWTDSVRSILGDTFYLSDGYMSDKVSIVDLLAHRVGVGSHDMTRRSGLSLDQMISRLRHLESSKEFRHNHQYSNLMYYLADKVIQTISGRASWEDILQDSFLDPLGMNFTTFVQKRVRWEDFATAYQDDAGVLREMSLEVNARDYDMSSTPGGVSLNAVDMAKWMNFQLSRGRAPDGTQLVDAGLLRDTHEHYGVTGAGGLYQVPGDPVTWIKENKGLGWFEGYYREYAVDGHSGSKAGFLSLYTLFPDVDIGVFTSMTGPMVQENDLVHMYVADLLLNHTSWLDADTVCDFVTPIYNKRESALTARARQIVTGIKDFDELTQARIQKDILGDRASVLDHVNLDEYGMDQIMMESVMDIISDAPKAGLTPLEDYTGVFGHFGYGNITIWMNETTNQLDMEYGDGPNVRWSLSQLSNTTFTADGYDEYWFMRYILEFTDTAGVYDHVQINFDNQVPPTFILDLQEADAPPPPVIP